MGMEKAFFRFWNPISAPIDLDEFRKLALMEKIDISVNGTAEETRTLGSTTLAKAYWILQDFRHHFPNR